MENRKDYIGPTFHKHQKIVLPEGPSADLNARTSASLQAAKTKLMGSSASSIEGKRLEKPLQMGPLLPNFKPQPRLDAKGELKTNISEVEKQVGSSAMLGNTHINSYQTLLKNDRLEKPRVKAWQDSDSSVDKGT